MCTESPTIIPLDDADKILAAFGIGLHSRGYQRWRRDDGFRQQDLEDVLNESDFILNVDWRELLPDAMDMIVSQLDELGIEASIDLDEEGERGVFGANGEEVRIRYSLSDEDNFDQVIAAINPLIEPMARYRKLRSSEGSDTWSYAILKNVDCRQLEQSAAGSVGLIFAEVRPASL
jgi:hypothetical protein